MDQDVRALKAELALLKLQFNERVAEVESRLDEVLAKEASTETITNSTSSVAKQPAEEPQQKSIKTVTQEDQVNAPNPWLHHPDAVKKDAQPKEAPNTRTEPVVNQPKDSQPSFISAFLHSILAMFLEWFSPVVEIYKTYKSKGTLGTFLLTLLGIGLTLSGFGYLMQLLIEQMGAGAKSLLMCGAAVAVSGLGIGLKIKTRFGDFATAIVALGILLAYSTVYFSGSVYNILPDAVLLFLYLAIALLCHILGNWLDTKVVAGLGIIGIATMPIVSNSLLVDPFYYLLSLAFVSASSLVLAYKRKEHWLANQSLVFCLVALEWAVAIEYVQISAWLLNIFYLQFFTYIGMSFVRSEKTEKQSLVMLAALVGSTVMLFFQASDVFAASVSMVFGFNSIITALVSIFFYKIRHPLTHLMVLVTSLWGILAIVSAISNTYWGIAWAVEGLLLLYIGRNYTMRAVVNQGQALTTVALIYCWAGLYSYFPLPALMSVDGWVLSLVIVAVIAIWQRLIDDSDRFDGFTQTRIKPVLQLLEVMWATALIVPSLDISIGHWTGVSVIFVQLLLLFRARQVSSTAIEVFTAALILIPIHYAYHGALMANSFSFMALPLFAKLALASSFAQLWLWSEFYQRYNPKSFMADIASRARLLFYMLLPVIWLGSAIRRLEMDILIVLWASPLIAYLLATKIKHHLLVKETKILTFLASLSLVILIGLMDLLYGLATLAGYGLYFVLAFMLEKKYQNTELGKFIASSAVISLAFVIPTFISVQFNSLVIGGIIASLMWVSYLMFISKFKALQRNERWIVAANGILIVASWILLYFDEWFVVSSIIFLAGSFYKRHSMFAETKIGARLGRNSDIFLNIILAITYTALLTTLMSGRFELLIAPLLAVHGAIILFLKKRRLTTVKFSFGLIGLGIVKLALIDAANAELWQKVLLFMGIGIFILAASFWYQKLVQKPEEALAEI